jgi:hypothetical protein
MEAVACITQHARLDVCRLLLCRVLPLTLARFLMTEVVSATIAGTAATESALATTTAAVLPLATTGKSYTDPCYSSDCCLWSQHYLVPRSTARKVPSIFDVYSIQHVSESGPLAGTGTAPLPTFPTTPAGLPTSKLFTEREMSRVLSVSQMCTTSEQAMTIARGTPQLRDRALRGMRVYFYVIT